MLRTKRLRRRRRVFYTEKQFEFIVRDILEHGEFRKLKNFFHHNSSIYEHSLSVAYLSYRIARSMGWDYHSAARGGLLHDFFLYDWRDKAHPDRPKGKRHGSAHPKIALQNSRTHFPINKVESDIIVKHMWPATFMPPKYRESFIVSFADKIMSSKEYGARLGQNIRRTGTSAFHHIKKVKRKYFTPQGLVTAHQRAKKSAQELP